MKIMSFLRNKAFWLMDSMKGNIVKNAYDDIKKIDEMDSDNAFISEYQKQHWEKLKTAACAKTKAYAAYVDYDFEQFPIITKQDIREAQDDYISTDFNKDKLIQMATSGSTGTPFVCYQNGGKKRRVNAEVIYYCEKVGYKLGENLSYIRTIVRQNKKSVLKQLMQNQTMVQCEQLSDDGIEKMLAAIRKYSQKGDITLLAYGSTYMAIKDYFVKNNVQKLEKCNVKCAISGSDMLFDETRAVISDVFGNIPVISRYSNEENGVIGQDEGLNNVFAINEADYIVEILDDNGNHLPDGSLGRIVVTDLFNFAMPMIRYDTGDMGAVQIFDINGRKKKCICQFGGRRADVIYDTNGIPLSPHAPSNAMWDFPDVTQFQLIQKDKNVYTLKLNVPDSFDRENELKASLLKVLGGDALIQIEKVDEIPVLSSGKRRYIINEYKK